MSLPALSAVPEVRADWGTLADSAADLRTEAGNARDALLDAKSSWAGLRTGYRHDGTSEQVWAGLDSLGQPAEDWAAALSSAKDAIDDFVTTGEPLQRLREALEDDRLRLAGDRSSALASDDEAEIDRVRGDILTFNGRVADLARDWDAAQDTLVAALGAIGGGTAEGLAVVSAPRTVSTGALDWAAMTSELDTSFGELDPRTIWRDLRGLSGEELRDWLEANPEAAQALAENAFPRHPAPGSAEDVMARAMAGDAPLTRDGITGIREAWLGLEDHERERLMLLFPGVIGNLNGVPLATRGQTNQVTVAGLRAQTAERLAALGDAPDYRDYLDTHGHHEGTYYLWQADREAWQAEHDRLATVRDGLDQAWAAYGRDQFPPPPSPVPAGYTTLSVSTEGNGRIATMRGTPGAGTERVATFVPGTGTTIASVDGYNRRLDAIDGRHDPAGTVSIYWAGTDFPQALVWDNRDSTFNERGAPLLAAFDHAADLDIPPSARTTAIGHSAGGSMLGTAERGPDGLTSDTIVYVAPAGQGHEVGSPSDTANPDAHRYWIQTNYDRIHLAQDLGGGGHGPSWWQGSDIDGHMGATRLESGYLASGEVMGKDDGFAGGHSLYFDPGSTSAQNLESVVHGGDREVVLYHEKEDIPGPRAGTTDPIVERQDELSAGRWDDEQVTTVRDLEE
ncbi:MAG: alpha/beta hydrolase [Micrococcus sp.]|nr:alpha/beta hydrolase [Micrococcus sp.]